MKIIHTQTENGHTVQVTLEDRGIQGESNCTIAILGKSKTYRTAHDEVLEAIKNARELLSDCRKTIELRIT